MIRRMLVTAGLLAVLGSAYVLAPSVAAADVMPSPPPRVDTTRDASRSRGLLRAKEIAKARQAEEERSTKAAETLLRQVPLTSWVFPMALAFAIPLILTILIEVPVVAIAGRASPGRSALAGILVNTLTNPPLVLAAGAGLGLIDYLLSGAGPPWDSPSRIALILLLEATVTAVEWRVFMWTLGWTSRRALATSVIANSLSFGIGLILVSMSLL